MVDPTSAAAAAKPVVGAVKDSGVLTAVGDYIRRVHGPTWDAKGALRVDEWHLKNLDRITSVAQAKLGNRIHDGGSIPPRVAMKIVTEGSWYEAPIAAEYFGGIAASSWNADPTNDRLAVWADRLAQLATNDILLHHLFYQAFRTVYLGRQNDLMLGYSQIRKVSGVFLPMRELLEIFRVPPISKEQGGGFAVAELVNSVQSLVTSALIDGVYLFGDGRLPDGSKGQGLWAAPATDGLLLMNFVYGHPLNHVNSAIDPSIAYESVEELPKIASPLAIGAVNAAATADDPTAHQGNEEPGQEFSNQKSDADPC